MNNSAVNTTTHILTRYESSGNGLWMVDEKGVFFFLVKHASIQWNYLPMIDDKITIESGIGTGDILSVKINNVFVYEETFRNRNR